MYAALGFILVIISFLVFAAGAGVFFSTIIFMAGAGCFIVHDKNKK